MVLSMDQVLECLRGNAAVPDKAVALTFDDGYELLRIRLSGACKGIAFRPWSMISDLLGPALELVRRRRAATPADHERRADPRTARPGHRLPDRMGASHLKLAQQSTELIPRRRAPLEAALEDVLGEQVRHFCYPYGGHDRRAVDAVADAGYASATTCVRGPASSADDPLTLPRKAISWGDNLLGYFWRLHMKNNPQDRADPPKRQRDLCRRPDLRLSGSAC